MSINLIDKTYYLKQLDFNPINNNKYVYFSGFNGEIKIYQNQWFFNFDMYINQKLNLPVNTLLANVSLPFCEVKKTTLSLNKTSKIPDFVIDKTTCDLYQTSFMVDTSTNTFFDCQLTNYQMYMNITFTIDEESLNNAKLDNNPNEIDKFINEFNLLNTNTLFYYSNFYNDKTNNHYDLNNSYRFENGKATNTNIKTLFYEANSYIDTKTPISKLLSFRYDGPFTVNGYKVNFVYQVDNQKEVKSLSYENKEVKNINSNFQIDFEHSTEYDFSKHEAYITIDSEKGFFIPEKAIGYYTITIVLCVNNIYMTFKITNNFNFVDSIVPNTFQIKSFFIDNLSNFISLQV